MIQNYSKRLGFTLVELLVCISIIAILASILLVAIGAVRESAKESKSLSNLRQIATAMQMHTSENNGLYPPGYFYKQGEGERIWMVELIPYIAQISDSNSSVDNVFVSPLVDQEIREGDLENGVIPSTYSVHGGLCPNISNVDSRIPYWNILNPSDIIIAGEATLRSNNTYASATFSTPSAFKTIGVEADLDAPIPTDTSDDGIGGALSYRADGSAPVAFVDGHVESIPKGSVLYKNIVIRK
ncbi:prepilin-type N-terminal cleavage/methylation domain-containing protein [Cerasicoccus frondis]|uniref:prepilin-type N-terminal cleavage/methylation domain-containing protein n=1 Tax=Cerasicoccus frondis TaxID=490090 RepID=UPI0028527B18|nr:prepilin-type N-terminal cleavage/methylation domain-containing protein [Cerasicoccus frondis]